MASTFFYRWQGSRPMMLALVVSAFSIVYLLAGKLGWAPPTSALIPNDLDLGTVWENPTFSHRIKIRNPTSGRIDITELTTSCSCTRLERNSLTLEAGEEVELPLLLDLSEPFHDPAKRNLPQTDFRATLLPKTTEKDRKPSIWTIKATVKRVVFPEANPIVLSATFLRAETRVPERIRLRTAADLDASTARVRCSASHATASVVSTPSRNEIEVDLSANPSLKAGRHVFLLDLEFARPLRSTATGTVQARLPIIAEVQAPVRLLPSMGNLGILKLGSRASLDLTVVPNAANLNWFVQKVDGGSDSLTTAIANHNTVAIQATADQIGHQTNKLLVSINVNNESIQLPFEVTYHGVK